MQIDPRYKTAFFHELGHYMAHELNRTSGQTKVTEIILRPHEKLNRIDGRLTHDYTTETTAEKLANIVHGCFFESIYLGRDFDVCFNAHESGEVDMFDYNYVLQGNGIDSDSDKRKALNQLNDRWFAELKKNSTVKKVLELDVESYLNVHPTISEAYLVNLEKLGADIPTFLAEYRELYSSYLNDIQDVLNSS